MVDARSKQRFLMSLDPQFQNNKMGLKCSGCQMVAAHVGLVVTMYEHTDSSTEDKTRHSKRVVGCQNCGKISVK